jgi:hypothetical protein
MHKEEVLSVFAAFSPSINSCLTGRFDALDMDQWNVISD